MTLVALMLGAGQGLSAFEDRVESWRTRVVVRSAEGSILDDRDYDGLLAGAAAQRGLSEARQRVPGGRLIEVGERRELLGEEGLVSRYRVTKVYELVGTPIDGEQVRSGVGAGTIWVSNAGARSLCGSLALLMAEDELVGCCSCAVAPGARLEFWVAQEGRRAKPEVVLENSVVARLRATIPPAGGCLAASSTEGPAKGMVAWATTDRAGPVPFLPGRLSEEASERLAASCARAEANGVGRKSCAACAGSWDGGRL